MPVLTYSSSCREDVHGAVTREKNRGGSGCPDAAEEPNEYMSDRHPSYWLDWEKMLIVSWFLKLSYVCIG
jgi:hypothetical protein